jgi:hypothetical protein
MLDYKGANKAMNKLGIGQLLDKAQFAESVDDRVTAKLEIARRYAQLVETLREIANNAHDRWPREAANAALKGVSEQ